MLGLQVPLVPYTESIPNPCLLAYVVVTFYSQVVTSLSPWDHNLWSQKVRVLQLSAQKQQLLVVSTILKIGGEQERKGSGGTGRGPSHTTLQMTQGDLRCCSEEPFPVLLHEQHGRVAGSLLGAWGEP